MRTFSVSSLFNSPDGPKKRSGRNVPGSPQRSLGKKNIKNKYKQDKTHTRRTGDLTIVQEDSRVMIDLILVDEDTSVFGYEVSIQDDVLCGA